jgi:phage terminase large subunit-like protein
MAKTKRRTTRQPRPQKPAPPPMDPVTAYATGVVARTIIAGILVRLACERHLRDLNEQAARGITWRAEQGQIAIDFFEQVLCLPDEAAEDITATDGIVAPGEGEPFMGKPFLLSPFQKFIVGSLFGWYTMGGHRRFRTSYIETAKGTGKTPLAAGVALFGVVMDRGIGKQVFSTGVFKDQARLCFVDATGMIAASPALRELLDVNANNIAHLESGSFFRPISSEKRGLDGKRVHIAIVEELHEHPTGIVVEKMRAGTKNRLDALIFIITNSGYDRTTTCWQLHEYSRKVLEGTVQNESWFAYVCQLDPCPACIEKGLNAPDDDCPNCDRWETEGPHWLKANPNIGVSLTWQYLREQVKEAVGMPEKRAMVMRLNFCLWTEQHTVWIGAAKWDACRVEAVSETNLNRLPAALGLDLSTTTDLTSACTAVRYDDAPDRKPDTVEITAMNEATGEAERKTLNLNYSVEFIPFFWMPEDKLRERVEKDRIPFDVWKKQGALRTTLGPVVDYDVMYDLIVDELVPRHAIRQVGYDPWNATQFALQLRDIAKLDVVEVKQGKMLSEAGKLLLALALTKRLRHAGNPVMGWCVSNALAKYDRFENLSIEKPNARQRIDGLIAALIALHLLIRQPQADKPQSVYAKRGAIVINRTQEPPHAQPTA